MLMQVDVPEYIAKRFRGKIIKWDDIVVQKELEELDGVNWETIVDFDDGEDIEKVLEVLK